MHTTRSTIALIVASVAMTGCTSTGAFNSASITDVQLSQANYEVVATNVSGRASAGYIFGISGTVRRDMQTIALARVEGTGMLYAEALEDLWGTFRAEHGNVEGRNLALVNIRYDTEALNLLVYTKPTVVVRADVVEFTD